MASKKNRATPFSLSFLDIMACGFGAVTLLFLILRHNITQTVTPDLRVSAEVNQLQDDIRDAEADKVELLNSLQKLDREVVVAQGLSSRVVTEINEAENSIQSDPEDDISILRKQVEELERETANMEEVEYGDKVRAFLGEGNRQYLTGLNLGGERVLILVDVSASMLADTVVNAVRRRNMEETQKKRSPKWQWTLRTVDWLLAQLPPSSRFQVYVFNTRAYPVVADSEGDWLDAADSLQLEQAANGLREVSPGGGTSLENAFSAISSFRDKPDNLFLLTDGLPTQGKSAPSKYMVSGAQRRKNFIDAVNKLPRGIPVNTILFPMEGDPEAAAYFWQFAIATNGAFIAPSRDWP